MGADDKMQNAMDDAKGTVKEGVGKVTDDPDLQAEGKADQVKAKVGKAVEDVKDAIKSV